VSEVPDHRTRDCEHDGNAAQGREVRGKGSRAVVKRRVVYRQRTGGGCRQHRHGPRVQRKARLWVTMRRSVRPQM